MAKSAEFFKRSETVILPKCWQEVELRKPDPGRLLGQKIKTVPELLTPLVAKLIAGEVTQEDFNREAAEPSAENIAFMSAFQDVVVVAAFVWPEIVAKNPNYKAGQMVLEDLAPEDRAFVYEWAMPKAEAVESAKSFRDESGEPVEFASNGTDLLATPL